VGTGADIKIELRGLTMAYGSFVVMRDINAQIKRGEIFIIMGGSGCGKSTLLRVMIGLKQPAQGDVFYDGTQFWQSGEEARAEKLHNRINPIAAGLEGLKSAVELNNQQTVLLGAKLDRLMEAKL